MRGRSLVTSSTIATNMEEEFQTAKHDRDVQNDRMIGLFN
ncbi:hypothetical protein AJ85_11675 [Alkalihalobacillus alcalophilus ATCC 27647 = CGMCC 1.3604]|uniref:Uncharacterized protein n=1 Tax=Alkalihalobacillus alcalophilus ATCC 27647 = CGMCC 1.3604 TaxID=1218173 RepID=A0A4S4JYB9_ALKAL|nr:hypothetical protein AJ85_11675 [Alkalihalobacillus alcalophilus ATCC 27647 = CGMCC 1.3604]